MTRLVATKTPESRNSAVGSEANNRSGVGGSPILHVGGGPGCNKIIILVYEKLEWPAILAFGHVNMAVKDRIIHLHDPNRQSIQMCTHPPRELMLAKAPILCHVIFWAGPAIGLLEQETEDASSNSCLFQENRGRWLTLLIVDQAEAATKHDSKCFSLVAGGCQDTWRLVEKN